MLSHLGKLPEGRSGAEGRSGIITKAEAARTLCLGLAKFRSTPLNVAWTGLLTRLYGVGLPPSRIVIRKITSIGEAPRHSARMHPDQNGSELETTELLRLKYIDSQA